MDTTRYTLEIVTPLFLRGPDGRTPELRPPSFKGMLRWWWRALHPMPISDLREKEGKRFGSAGNTEARRSLVRIRLLDRDLEEDLFSPVPTHDFDRPAFKPGQQFDLLVTMGPRASGSGLQAEINATIQLMLLLGGIGWRARRGMGSLRPVAIDGASVEPSMDALGKVQTQLGRLRTPFEREGLTIKYVGEYAGREGPGYPWVRRVETGIPSDRHDWETMTQHIANVASEENSRYTGHHDPRVSSPLYVTVGHAEDSYWPLLTSLNLPPSTEEKVERHTDSRPDFREALL